MSSPYRSGRPSTQEPPNAPGEYRIIDGETKSVKYLGETADLSRRRSEHERTGKFDPSSDLFAWQKADGRSTSATRREHEARKIEEHDPPLNQRAGGGGRPYGSRAQSTNDELSEENDAETHENSSGGGSLLESFLSLFK